MSTEKGKRTVWKVRRARFWNWLCHQSSCTIIAVTIAVTVALAAFVHHLGGPPKLHDATVLPGQTSAQQEALIGFCENLDWCVYVDISSLVIVEYWWSPRFITNVCNTVLTGLVCEAREDD